KFPGTSIPSLFTFLLRHYNLDMGADIPPTFSCMLRLSRSPFFRQFFGRRAKVYTEDSVLSCLFLNCVIHINYASVFNYEVWYLCASDSLGCGCKWQFKTRFVPLFDSL
uniref:Uncharacterized protein n=1 Tax=Terrapene triunguis TaxID=2587831 RepID=A0A674K5N6_9SAUR